jgi:hypothetical protein
MIPRDPEQKMIVLERVSSNLRDQPIQTAKVIS